MSPFINLPTATTLPYTYKTLPSTLPPSSTGTDDKAKYVVTSTGHSAHPDDIILSCKALQDYIKKSQEDADARVNEWEETIRARDLAEKRRLAPGWLDSDSHGILEPERKDATKDNKGKAKQDKSLMDTDASGAEAAAMDSVPASAGTGAGDELDRAFGGLGI